MRDELHFDVSVLVTAVPVGFGAGAVLVLAVFALNYPFSLAKLQ